jgi:flagellar biosynthesis chaperone FliJ
MKKMKFRLEHVLRLREFDEKKAKLELGNILGRISAVNLEMDEAKKQISEASSEYNIYISQTRRSRIF